jgi:WD40 repeat protein
VTAVAWSPDGKTLAVADETAGGLRLLDVPSRKQRLDVLKGHKGGINCLAFSVDGKVLVSAGQDKTIMVWDPESGKLLRTLSGHSEPILAVAFAPREAVLATASRDGTVRVWNADNGRERAQGKHDRPVNSVAFCPVEEPGGQKLLATGGSDRTVRVWRARGCQLLHTFDRNASNLRVAWLDRQTVVSLDDNRRLRHWDIRGGALRQTILGVARLGQFAPDGRSLVIGLGSAYSSALRFIDSTTGLAAGTILTMPNGRSLLVSTEGHYNTSARSVEDEIVYVVQTEAGQETLPPADFAKRFGWKNDPGHPRWAPGAP